MDTEVIEVFLESSKLCHCGNELSSVCSMESHCGNELLSVCSMESHRGLSDISLLVALFEHVNASGVPNFQCCRISLPNSKLNMPSWCEKLREYEDRIVCDYSI